MYFAFLYLYQLRRHIYVVNKINKINKNDKYNKKLNEEFI